MYKHTIRFMALGLITVLMVIPIVMNWKRVPSPNVPFKKNIEFNTTWDDPNRPRNMYVVVITYRHNVKPNDTIQCLYTHPPSDDDIMIASWFNETYSFYAPDNAEAREYMFVQSVKVIKWYTIVNDPQEWERIKQTNQYPMINDPNSLTN